MPKGSRSVDNMLGADPVTPVTASSTRRLISIGGSDTHTTLERVRRCAYYCRPTPVKRVDQHER